MMDVIQLLVVLFIGGVLLTALFEAYETGFISSNVIRVRNMAERGEHRSAPRLLRYMEQPDHIITLVLIATTFGLVLGTFATVKLLGPVWALLLATPLFLIFGEVLPKSVARLHPTRLALGLLPVVRLFEVLLLPVVLPVTWLSRRFLALMEAEQREIRTMMTSQDDVRVLIDETADQGAIDPEEQVMIHSVMDLQRRTAREIMVPRISITALPETASRKELVETLRDSGHTRVPIYRETVDEILGVVRIFDLLMDERPEDFDIQRFIRPVLHVPDSIKLDELLQQMRRQKQSMAVLTDEYGGTDGIVTVEDILEEIFGEIHDEHDKDERRIRRVGRNAYAIDARMSLQDAADYMKLDLQDEAVETVGGWIMHLVGRIPQRGEVVEFERFRVTILEGGPNYISSVRLEVLPVGEAQMEKYTASTSSPSLKK